MLRSLIIFICAVVQITAQTYKFAWITDTHIGYPEANSELDTVVSVINSMNEIKFVLATGDITEKGRNSELTTAKEILEKLRVPYYIIPGNHDTKWSESGCTKFAGLWGDDKFKFEFAGDVFIGLNSGIPWRGGGGHIKPEDLLWLEDEISKIDTLKEVYLAVHHPLDADVDNWFEVTNILRGHKIKAVLHGHGHSNKLNSFNGIPAAMSRSTLSKNQKSWGFTLVENSEEKLKFYEVDSEREPGFWGEIDKTITHSIPQIDSSLFINYSTNFQWQYDLESTLSTIPLIWEEKIYTADINGNITCYDTSGIILWDYTAFGNMYSKPAAMDGYLVLATIQGDLITLNAYTGEQLQTIGFDDTITSQLIMIDYKGESSLMFPKSTESKAAVVFGTANGKMYCYDVETLQEYWSNDKANGMIETEPLYINNKIIYGSWDTNLYCIDARTGLLIWKWSESDIFYYAPAACKPVTDGKKVYIATPEKFVYAIDLNLGTTSWKKNNFNAWESIGISADRKLLFIKSFENHFHVVSTITTNWVKDLNLKFGVDTMPVTPIEWNKNILFGTKNGDVYLIGKNYSAKKLFFMGTSRVHTIQHVKGNQFLASNMDGKLVLFSIN